MTWLGWGALAATALGLFYAVAGPSTPMTTNRRRRRSSRKARLRRNTRRRRTRRRRTRRRVTANLRRYKALSASARRSMPQSYFALSGKRFPIRGPKGSSRERDKWQAMQAIRYLNMGRVGSRADYLKVRNAIIRRYGANFWRKHGGPTWPKIQKAKRRRKGTRRRRSRRRSSRRVAANPRNRRRVRRNDVPRRVSRRGRVPGMGVSKEKTLPWWKAEKYGLKPGQKIPEHIRRKLAAKKRRRVSRNVKRRKSTRRRTPRKKLPDWMNKTIYWGRDGNAYYVQAPNRNVRVYRGKGSKATAEELARDLADRYGLPKRKDDGRLRRRYAKMYARRRRR